MIKRTLAALASATVLGACATGPYYDSGYPNYGYGYGYGGYGTTYYDPFYVAPSVGIGAGVTYYDNDYNHRRHYGHRDGHRVYRDGYRSNDGQWVQRSEIPRSAPQANFEQDVYNQGRDGRGWSKDGTHSGG